MLGEDQMKLLMNLYSEEISFITAIDWKVQESHKSSHKFVSASIIKIYLLYYALKYRDKFPDSISVSNIELTEDTVLKYLKGNWLNFEGLLAFMIYVSDNAAANYFLDVVGIEQMNSFLQSEGFHGTEFQRRFLDVNARKEGRENYTSASDVLKLFKKVFSENTLSRKDTEFFDSIMKLQFDRTKLSFYLPEIIPSGGKTGVLENVWNDVLYFQEGSQYALIVFLTKNVPEIQVRDMLPAFGYYFVKDNFPRLL